MVSAQFSWQKLLKVIFYCDDFVRLSWSFATVLVMAGWWQELASKCKHMQTYFVCSLPVYSDFNWQILLKVMIFRWFCLVKLSFYSVHILVNSEMCVVDFLWMANLHRKRDSLIDWTIYMFLLILIIPSSSARKSRYCKYGVGLMTK